MSFVWLLILNRKEWKITHTSFHPAWNKINHYYCYYCHHDRLPNEIVCIQSSALILYTTSHDYYTSGIEKGSLPAKYMRMEIKAAHKSIRAILIHFHEHRSDTRQSFWSANLEGEYWFLGRVRELGAPFPVNCPPCGELLGNTGRITGADGIPVCKGLDAGGPVSPPTNLCDNTKHISSFQNYIYWWI